MFNQSYSLQLASEIDQILSMQVNCIEPALKEAIRHAAQRDHRSIVKDEKTLRALSEGVTQGKGCGPSAARRQKTRTTWTMSFGSGAPP